MKRFPVLSILYYGFTIIIGIVLAFYFLAYGETVKVANTLSDYSSDNNYYGIVRLLSVYQNPEAVLTGELTDGTDYAVYEVDTTYSVSDEDSNTYYYLEKGYMGIINNLGDGWDRSDYTDGDGVTDNNFGLLFNGINEGGEAVSYTFRIGYYSDNTDDISDDELTVIQNRYYSYQTAGFYYFMIGDQVFEEYGFSEVSSFTFVNGDESQYETVSSLNWNLESDFFTTVESFNTSYNNLIANGGTSDDINTLSDKFLETYNNTSYSVSNYSEVVKYVQLQSILKILAYFLIIYIIGDFLVGKHRIIHLFARIFGKNKGKALEEVPEYMQDYEVNVIFKAIVSSEYNKEITIKYQSEANDEVVFHLKASEGYETSKRIKNGLYSHPEIICEGLKCVDVPSTINVKGFKFVQEFEFEMNHLNNKESE